MDKTRNRFRFSKFRMVTLILFFFMASAFTVSATTGRGIRVAVKGLNTGGEHKVLAYSGSRALVIGIDEYTAGWPRLSAAVSDSKQIAATLSEVGFEVTSLHNPDSEKLTRAFRDFFVFQGAEKETRLFVWFAGHGHSEDGEGFIIPADAPLPDKGALFRYKALSMRRFGEYVRLAKSNHVYTVFDACFSGTIFSTQRSAPPVAVTRSALLPVRQFLSSGDANQTVSDNGLFCKLFIRAISGLSPADANRDGYLTGSELGMFLTDRMTNLSEATQTPRYGKLRDPDFDRGDYIFVLPRPDMQPVEVQTTLTTGQKPYAPNPETEMWAAVKTSENPEDYETFIRLYPESPLVPTAKVRLRQLTKKRPAQSINPTIRTQKKVYNRGETVIVEYAGLPGNQGDWFTVIPKDEPDTTYGDYDYTYGNTKGQHPFKNLEPGDYEVRLYLDWPKGNYTVHSRYGFTVR